MSVRHSVLGVPLASLGSTPLAVLMLVLSCAAMTARGAEMEYKNAARLGLHGGGGSDAWGFVATAEYERYLGSGFAVGLRPGFLTYGYEDDSYTEDGDGFGVDFVARYYFTRRGLRDPYVGVGLGIWGTSWEWEEDDGWYDEGDGDSVAVNFQAEFGYRFLMAQDRFSITPHVFIGDYVAVSSDDEDSEFGFYAGVGVVFGFQF